MFVVVWCPRRSVALTEDQSSSTSPPSGFISITDFTPTPHSEMADGAPVALTANHLQQLLTQLQQQNAALREELNDMRNQGTHVAGFVSAAVQQTLQQNPPTTTAREAKGADLEPFSGDRKKTESFLHSVRLSIALQPRVYPTELRKILYTLSWMNEGMAGAWAESLTT